MSISSFSVALSKAPGLSDDERRRRLAMAFDLLLTVGDRQTKTADPDSFAGKTESAASSDALVRKPEAQKA